MPDYTPIHTGGAIPYTSVANATITGGQILIQSGSLAVAPAGAASTVVVGVAAHDAVLGQKITVWPIKNVTHEVASTGTINPADGVITGAAGVAATGAIATAAGNGTLIGKALTGATGGAAVRFIGW